MAVTIAHLLGTVSPSKLSCAEQCLAKFFFRYVLRLPHERTAALAIGSALDDAGNCVYRTKRKTGKTPSVKDTQEQFAAAWDFEAATVDKWGDDKRGDMLDNGVRGIAKWRDNVAQHFQPEEEQRDVIKEVTCPVSGEAYNLRGIVDAVGTLPKVSDRRVVADLKNSSRRYNAGRLVRELQPVIYTTLVGVPDFEFHVVTRTKEPTTQRIGRHYSDSDRDAMLLRAGMIRRQIATAYRTGDWLPNRTHNMCSRRYCDFWQSCQRQFGGEVPA